MAEKPVQLAAPWELRARERKKAAPPPAAAIETMEPPEESEVSMKPEPTLKERILTALRGSAGLTNEELHEIVGGTISSVRTTVSGMISGEILERFRREDGRIMYGLPGRPPYEPPVWEPPPAPEPPPEPRTEIKPVAHEVLHGEKPGAFTKKITRDLEQITQDMKLFSPLPIRYFPEPDPGKASFWKALLAKLPDFDGAWAPEVQEEWWRAYARLIDQAEEVGG